MEEPDWPIFQDRRHTTGKPGGWLRTGMVRLQSGDHLTLYDAEQKVLWSGELLPLKAGWFRTVSPGTLDWHPADISNDTWRSWLTADPPIQAALRSPVERIPDP